MAEEQVVGVREQSDPSAAATPDAEAQKNDALAAPTPPAADEEVAADEASVAGELDELVAKASERDEYLALAQRTQADFENYRKRVARDSAAAESRGLARLARELLPALDSLDRALAAAADADEGLIEGLRLVQRELLGALERVGVEPYGAAGEQFDPELHEAVAQQPFDGRE
ncbi:MAG TPA: nucleotide exchange factor GrpE, partial [Gaiellaceae bacterium]|nr:nucleotide exchange factor GrpE [Gaiellaceae bacterium]